MCCVLLVCLIVYGSLFIVCCLLLVYLMFDVFIICCWFVSSFVRSFCSASVNPSSGVDRDRHRYNVHILALVQ